MYSWPIANVIQYYWSTVIILTALLVPICVYNFNHVCIILSLLSLQDKLTLEELQFSDGERLAAEREIKKG